MAILMHIADSNQLPTHFFLGLVMGMEVGKICLVVEMEYENLITIQTIATNLRQ